MENQQYCLVLRYQSQHSVLSEILALSAIKTWAALPTLNVLIFHHPSQAAANSFLHSSISAIHASVSSATMNRFILAIVGAIFLSAPARAMIPSFGLETASAIRSAFNDSDFVLNFNRGQEIDGGTFTAQFVDLNTFPVLAGQDVQSTLVRATVNAGTAFPTHSHPRASETFTVTKGAFEVFFVFEGLVEPRVVRNIVRKGEATVFPQGLAHGVKCISKYTCIFDAVLNSADIGVVAAMV